MDEPREHETVSGGGPVPVSDAGAGPAEAPPEEASAEPAEDELAATARQRDEYLDALQRLKAEFDNYRKRSARDQSALVERATERLVRELVPVLDDLERALEAVAAHEEAKLEDGVRLVHRALADALAREGLTEIPTGGQFDPHSQEALLAQPSDEPEGTVIGILQKGYRLGDRVLRPARVIVAGAPVTEPAGTEPAGTEPAGTETAGTEPAGTEPAGAEPPATEPVAESTES